MILGPLNSELNQTESLAEKHFHLYPIFNKTHTVVDAEVE